MFEGAAKRSRAILAILLISSTIAVSLFSFDSSIGSALLPQNDFPYEKMDLYAQEFSSHLPILVMQTDIPELHNRENPPLTVMWLFDSGGENRLTDAPTEVFHSVTANYRGFSSLSFPKKSYKINLYDNINFYKPLDYSFFGLGESSEWVLRTPYADKSLLRDWFCYEVAATVLYWQPRGKPVQVFIQDGETGMITYEGVYFFCEYITVEESRLDLGQFTLSSSERIDVNGGGYLYQRDREREYGNVLPVQTDIAYRLMHPISSSMSSREEASFKDEVIFYHEFLTKTGKYAGIPDDEWDYWNYIDVDSFIDYMLVAELTQNKDAGRLSTFMYRPVGGKLIMGPLWDADLSMGNDDYLTPLYNTFYPITRYVIRPLASESQFTLRLIDRWRELRGSIWSDSEILGLFDAMAEYLVEPAAQNAERWPELYDGETLIVNNPEPYTTSWEEEISRTRDWLESRLIWLDEAIPRLPQDWPNEIAREINSAAG